MPTFKKVPSLRKIATPPPLNVTNNSMSESRGEKARDCWNSLRPVKNVKIRSRKVQASLTASSKNIC